MEIKVAKNHFEYGSKKYFRKGAESVQIGKYGNKVTHILTSNGLDPVGTVKITGALAVNNVTSFSFTTVKTTSGAFTGNLTFTGAEVNGQVSGNMQWSSNKIGDYSLIKMEIENPIELVPFINADSNCFNTLKDVANGRICDQVFIVVKSSLIQGKTFSGGGSLSLNDSTNTLNLTLNVSGSTSNSLTLTVNPGAIFAYGLKKPKFNTPNKKNATKVTSLSTDEWGMS